MKHMARVCKAFHTAAHGALRIAAQKYFLEHKIHLRLEDAFNAYKYRMHVCLKDPRYYSMSGYQTMEWKNYFACSMKIGATQKEWETFEQKCKLRDGTYSANQVFIEMLRLRGTFDAFYKFVKKKKIASEKRWQKKKREYDEEQEERERVRKKLTKEEAFRFKKIDMVLTSAGFPPLDEFTKTEFTELLRYSVKTGNGPIEHFLKCVVWEQRIAKTLKK